MTALTALVARIKTYTDDTEKNRKNTAFNRQIRETRERTRGVLLGGRTEETSKDVLQAFSVLFGFPVREFSVFRG